MAKAFTTFHPIRGKELLLRRMVCELRFNDGQLYLDHCGRLLKRLAQDAEWVVSPETSPKGALVLNMSMGAQLTFSMNAAALTLDKVHGSEVIEEEEAGRFLAQVEPVLGLVIDELEASEFLRLGFREVYYCSCDSKEEAQEWIRALQLVSVAPTLSEAYQGKIEALGIRLVVEGEVCHYRIAVDAIERPAQIPVGELTLSIHKSGVHEKQNKALTAALKNKRQRQLDAAFAATLDIDAFQLAPLEPSIGEFVNERHATNLELFRAALPPDGSGRK